MDRQTANDLSEVMRTLGRHKRATALVKQAPTDGSGRFTAIVSTFGPPPDSQGDVIAPGAFLLSITDWRARGKLPALWWQHEYSNPAASLGVIQRMYEEDEGLVIEGQLDLDHEPAVAVYEGMLSGRLNEFSIGYAVIREHRESSPKFGKFNVLDEVELLEVSVVSAGANRFTRLIDVKSAPTPAHNPNDTQLWLDRIAAAESGKVPAAHVDVDSFVTQVRMELVEEHLRRAEQERWEQQMVDSVVLTPVPVRVDERMRPDR